MLFKLALNSYGSGDGLLAIINSPKLPCSYLFYTPLGLVLNKNSVQNQGAGA